MKTTLFFIFSLITIFSGYCTNKEEAVECFFPISTQWVIAMTSGNIIAVDSLIEQQASFPLLDTNDLNYWDVEFSDIENDLLSKIYYYCLNKNRSHASTIELFKYYYNNDLIHSYYTDGDYDKIYRNEIFYLRDSNDSIDYEYDNKIKLLSDALSKNLEVLHHIILKRKNITWREAARMIYAVGPNDAEWGIEPISVLYFYKKIYPHPELFSSERDFSLENTFLFYVATEQPDNEVLHYLINNIDSKKMEELFVDLYPERDTDEWDRDLSEAIPSYSAEVILMQKYPQISQYSGYNLLHAAIVNVDINLVRQLINTNLKQEKTVSRHSYFYEMYGDKPLSPLELALYKQKQWKDEYDKDDSDQKLPEKFRLQQIKKIIELLE